MTRDEMWNWIQRFVLKARRDPALGEAGTDFLLAHLDDNGQEFVREVRRVCRLDIDEAIRKLEQEREELALP